MRRFFERRILGGSGRLLARGPAGPPPAPLQPSGTLQAVSQSSTGSFTGTVTGGVTANDPITILGLDHFWIADNGLTQSGGFADALANQVGADNFSGTTTTRPSVTSSDSTLGNRRTLSFDGTDDFMSGGPNFVAPGTTLIWWFGVFKLRTWGPNGAVLWGGTIAGNGRFGCRTSANNVNVFNGTHGPTATMTPDTWYYCEGQLNNAVADYLRVGSASAVSGTALGNTDNGALLLGAGTAGTANRCAMDFACLGFKLGTAPGATPIADNRTWGTNWFGGSLDV